MLFVVAHSNRVVVVDLLSVLRRSVARLLRLQQTHAQHQQVHQNEEERLIREIDVFQPGAQGAKDEHVDCEGAPKGRRLRLGLQLRLGNDCFGRFVLLC